jgi:hypothetical protein
MLSTPATEVKIEGDSVVSGISVRVAFVSGRQARRPGGCTGSHRPAARHDAARQRAPTAREAGADAIRDHVDELLWSMVPLRARVELIMRRSRHPRNVAEEIAYVEELIPRWKSAHDGLTRLCLVSECTSVFVEQKLTWL